MTWFSKKWDERELNEIVKQIEITVRKECTNPNRRFGAMSSEIVLRAIFEHKIGFQCKKCFNKKFVIYEEKIEKKDWDIDGEIIIHKGYYGKANLDKSLFYKEKGRYCCEKHRNYYQPIVSSFYFKPEPWEKGEGDSIDHILPIANGGLEFDRDNLQWMDLIENIKKNGGKRYTERIKQKAL